MRLISLKTCKVPAIVICMLAAGICYSCGGHPDPSVPVMKGLSWSWEIQVLDRMD